MAKDMLEKLIECQINGYYMVDCPKCGGVAKAEADASQTVCTSCGHKMEVEPLC